MRKYKTKNENHIWVEVCLKVKVSRLHLQYTQSENFRSEKVYTLKTWKLTLNVTTLENIICKIK